LGARATQYLGGVGATFAAAECVGESFRGTKDPINAGIGGLAAGSLVGVYTARPASMCLGIGLVCGLMASLADGIPIKYEPERIHQKQFGVRDESYRNAAD